MTTRPGTPTVPRGLAAHALPARPRSHGGGARLLPTARPWGDRGISTTWRARGAPSATPPSGGKQDSALQQQPTNGPGWEWDKESFADEESESSSPWKRLFKRQKKKPYFIREWLSEADPGLNQSLISSGTTISQLFDQDKWENHRSMKRYFRELKLMPQSTVLRRIVKPCSIVTAVGLFVCVWNEYVVPLICASLTSLPAERITLGMGFVTHSLIGGAISLLLVFRTNSCHARFCEGRLLWGRAVAAARRWSMLMSMSVPQEYRAKSKDYIKVWAVVLKSHLRQGRTRNTADPTAYRDDPTAYVRSVLSEKEANFVLQQKNKPLVMLAYMSAVMNHVIPHVSYTTHSNIQATLDELGNIAGGCERLLSTPIPLSYTRHCVRTLLIWLLTAPLALYHHCGWAMVPMLYFTSFLMLGIDELAAQIEEPFSILPLTPLVEVIKREADETFAMADHLLESTLPEGAPAHVAPDQVMSSNGSIPAT